MAAAGGGRLQRFLASDATAGGLLLATAAVALLVAGSSWGGGYAALWELRVGPAAVGLEKPLLKWINDGLMVLFFLFVGLEIKREVLAGALADRRAALLPAVAAIGGMAIPALIYAAFGHEGVGASGWAIPMATDIAFALGVLALLGSRVPVAVKVFLAALAILDDLGAVLVIALFYTSGLSLLALAAGLGLLGVLAAFGRFGVRSVPLWIAVSLAVWFAFLASGIHTTVAGVLVAMTIPLGDPTNGPVARVEHALKPWVMLGVMPIFAFANAGVAIGNVGEALAHPVAAGIAAGLVVGKPLGVAGAAWLAVKAGWARLPDGVTWTHVIGASALCGIGFTMSLFIGSLAFGADPALLDVAKVGVLAASAVSGTLGFVILRFAGPAPAAARSATAAGSMA